MKNLIQLSNENEVYIIHSKSDKISKYEFAYDTIYDMNFKEVLILENDDHCKYHYNVKYQKLIKSISI